MGIYVLVSFWLTVFTTSTALLELLFREKWPVERKASLGETVVKAIVGVAFAVWAGLLLWGL